jgi:outer membrane protein TolC
MVMPRSDFGVREAQVTEMRARAEAASRLRDESERQVRAGVRGALFALNAASRRRRVQEDEVVPRARRALDSTRAAYESNRSGYLDLLDTVRRLLDARLGLADARRDVVHAHAGLLQAVGADPMGGN